MTFTAVPVNGGGATYEWFLNNVSVQNSSSLTYTNSAINTGDQVKCIMTSTFNCGTPITSNSNTITIVENGMLIGNGVGQQSRVRGCRLAIANARTCKHGKKLKTAVAYSDSFFPFVDGPMTLIRAGIRAVFATTASIRDAEVLACFLAHEVTFYTLPDSVARGFFGH